jgi:mevalonate kinase
LINNEPAFFTHLKQLINFELQYLSKMIPYGSDPLIRDALSQNVYIKLLGSGGGGFLLAIAPSSKTMDQWAESKRVKVKMIND